MSVRNLGNIPCVTCGQDTLHLACKCTVCGTVWETAPEARRRVMKKVRGRMRNRGIGPGVNVVAHSEAKRAYVEEHGIGSRDFKDVK